MVRMFVRHTVAEFAGWKQGYDAFDETRRALGVQGDAVFRGTPDGHDVTAWHDFETIEAAQAFVQSPELATAMQSAGVTSEPQIWFVERDLPA